MTDPKVEQCKACGVWHGQGRRHCACCKAPSHFLTELGICITCLAGDE